MSLPSNVVVHPLVLLSTVDHYNRVARDTKRRVVGVLLGETFKGQVDVTNSFAVPFEEVDDGRSDVWYLDRDYLEAMYDMFRKVSARERIVGWYSTGPQLRPADLAINTLFCEFCQHPVLVIIDPTKASALGLPTRAYVAAEEIEAAGEGATRSALVFRHLPSSVGALEAEEVGVEHLLRDIKDTNVSTLSEQITQRALSLRSLKEHLDGMRRYLEMVESGAVPANHEIIHQIQDVFNLMPDTGSASIARAFAAKTNDMAMLIYVSNLVRAVTALHNLILNKRELKEAEADEAAAIEGKSGSGSNKKKADKDEGGDEKDGGDAAKEGGDGGKGKEKVARK